MQSFLMRHGQDLNPDQNRLTNTDPGLSELGKEQAARCAIKIKTALGSNVAPIIVASPRTRTMQAATIVAIQFDEDPAGITSDVRLKERDCAAFSGQLVAEVFSRTEEDLIAGGMEPYSKLEERLEAFYSELRTKTEAAIIIITHSGNIEPFMKLANANHSYTLEPDNFIPLTL